MLKQTVRLHEWLAPLHTSLEHAILRQKLLTEHCAP